MERILLTDDELKLLEKRFGPGVRQMGPWNSDGPSAIPAFGWSPWRRAAETLEDPNLIVALSHLKHTPQRNKPFIELLETFGATLIERVVAAHRECSLELMTGIPLALKPPTGRPEGSP